MKVMQDLYISLDDINFEEFYTLITNDTPNNWVHKPNKEEKYLDFKIQAICFEYHNEHLHAGLSLSFKSGENELFVPNIIPLEKPQLSIKEYNEVLNNFFQEIIAPRKAGYSYRITSDEHTLESELDMESVNKLRVFSSCANKSTGISHPSDQKRWFDFIYSSFQNSISLELLRYFLVEDGWDEESANKLSLNYEFAVDLLKHGSEQG